MNCSHPSNNFVQNNNENHHVVCKICGYSKTENHEFVVGETTMICNRCGFEKSLPCSHNYIYNNYYDKIGHQMKCTICGDIKKSLISVFHFKEYIVVQSVRMKIKI